MPPKIKVQKKRPIEVNNKEELFEGKRYFKDPKIISEHLICGICQEIFEEPWRLTCGHSFCKECIDPWLLTNRTCPIDRIPVNQQFCHKDILVANIIGDYQLACPWRPFGCTIIDKYYIVKDHKNKCVHNPNKMDKVMQDKAMKMYNELILSPMPKCTPSPTHAKSGSALEELMNQLGDGPLDSSFVEENALPEQELLPLSMRMYINGDELSKKYVCSMLQSEMSAASHPTNNKQSKKH